MSRIVARSRLYGTAHGQFCVTVPNHDPLRIGTLAAIIDAGVGNTLTLTVPIETSSGKEIMKFELRLTGSSARLINF